MRSTLVHIKAKYELKIIVPFVFHLILGFKGQIFLLVSGQHRDGSCTAYGLPEVGGLPGEWTMLLSAVESHYSEITEVCKAFLSLSPPNATVLIVIIQSGDFIWSKGHNL